jgi:hypothetical protein
MYDEMFEAVERMGLEVNRLDLDLNVTERSGDQK